MKVEAITIAIEVFTLYIAVSRQDNGTSLKQDPLVGLGGRVGIDDVED